MHRHEGWCGDRGWCVRSQRRPGQSRGAERGHDGRALVSNNRELVLVNVPRDLRGHRWHQMLEQQRNLLLDHVVRQTRLLHRGGQSRDNRGVNFLSQNLVRRFRLEPDPLD